ncbi:hypothetical protein SAMCCGM7_pC0590 (plasmid) [Sinorhizobium americanum CCGM7]|nr:hypothetical protein SAMCCGM7_pC0590 [Sinorhizobium americanum CCGM7]
MRNVAARSTAALSRTVRKVQMSCICLRLKTGTIIVLLGVETTLPALSSL